MKIYFTDGSTNFKGKDLGEILIDMEDEEHVMEVTTQSQIVEQNVADSRPSVVMEPEPQMEDEEIGEPYFLMPVTLAPSA